VITTSQSAVRCYQTCPRKRYWQYEAENGHAGEWYCKSCQHYFSRDLTLMFDKEKGARCPECHVFGLDTVAPGWERRRLALPLVTGIFVHRGLESALKGETPNSAASHARGAYLEEVSARGLAVEEGTDEQAVVEEQAAHVEGLVLAWCRVRLPKWQDEYEIIEVEVEDRVPLSEDIVLAVRADAIVRRKYDHRMFVVNFKTVAQADDRWIRSWEVDMQLMTELLAAERRHGSVFGGVIIEGLIKGRRMPDKAPDGSVTGYHDATPLLYGYKIDANPPLAQLEYTHEYTRRKGWYKFPTWRESFGNTFGAITECNSSLNYWVNWLPEETVEAQFAIVPPIMRDEQRIESKVRQIVTMEHNIVQSSRVVASLGLHEGLDYAFPSNEQECYWPSRCQCFDLCYTAGVAADPAGSGLYMPRVDHHQPMNERGEHCLSN
jgi:hypothetical protein